MKDKNLEKLINRNSEYLQIMKTQRESKKKEFKPELVVINDSPPAKLKIKHKKPVKSYIDECIKLLKLPSGTKSSEVARKVLSVTGWPLKKKLVSSVSRRIIRRYVRTVNSGKPIHTYQATSTNSEFYRSRSWRELRYQVFMKYNRKCMCCGATPENNNIVIHVDHIKPRSKYPKLELDIDNMQVLCEDCNLGKSNISEEDFRPIEEPPLDDDALAHMMSIKIS